MYYSIQFSKEKEKNGYCLRHWYNTALLLTLSWRDCGKWWSLASQEWGRFHIWWRMLHFSLMHCSKIRGSLNWNYYIEIYENKPIQHNCRVKFK